MPDPLLTYVFVTDPAPLMASGPVAPQQGRINTGVFSRGQQVYCDKITIAVPVGETATDAYLQPPASSVSTSRWLVVSVQLQKGDQLGLDDALSYAVATFVPRDPTDDLLSYSLVLGLIGTVSPASGTFACAIQEHSGTTPDRTTYVNRQATYPLTKDPTQLYLRNLVATTQDKQTVPVTQVPAGMPLRLEWSSSGTWFELYAGDQPAPVYRGQATSIALNQGITRDTTFFLLASATGQGSGNGQGGFQTIYAYACLTLAVTSPTLPGLTVAGPLAVTGTAALGTAAVGDVGTLQPASRLHVNLASSGTPVHAMQIDAQSFQTPGNATASRFLLVRDISAADNGNYFVIRGDGNVGIGHPSPANPLHLAAGKTLRIEGGSSSSDSASYFSFGGNGAFSIDAPGVPSGRFVVQNSGDVGVGTNQPASRLHVNVASSGSPVQAMQIDVQSFQTMDNARASHFLLVQDIGAGAAHFYIRGDGGVGMGTTDTENQRLCVQGPTWLKGDLFVSGSLNYWWGPDNQWKVINNRAGDWAGSSGTNGPTVSDGRLKTDLRPICHALEKVRKLQGIRYRWGEPGLEYLTRDIAGSVSAGPDATDEQHDQLRQAERRKAVEALAGDLLGLVAQDVETVIPELVHEDGDGYKHIRYHHLTAVLIEAIKELDAEVRALSAKAVR